MTTTQANAYRKHLIGKLGCGIEYMTNGAVFTFWRSDTGKTLANFSHTDEPRPIECAHDECGCHGTLRPEFICPSL